MGFVVSDDLICDYKVCVFVFSVVVIFVSIVAYVWFESAYFFFG